MEEVDLVAKGANYQWPYREGRINGAVKPSPLIGYDQPPVYDYPHADGNGCVIGGYVYRGATFAAELGGKCIFGDNGSGRIWAMSYDGTNDPVIDYLATMPAGQGYTQLSSFGLNQAQELYMCKMGANGGIYQLVRDPNPPPPLPPLLLSLTGVFADTTNLVPAAALLPYGPNSPLWSDGAWKARWIAVPTNAPISFSPTGTWSFPTGTVFVKHFELPVNETNATIRRRLETRLLVCNTNGTLYGFTYKWRADNSDADLLTNRLSEAVTITTAGGDVRTQVWTYPQSRRLPDLPHAERRFDSRRQHAAVERRLYVRQHRRHGQPVAHLGTPRPL